MSRLAENLALLLLDDESGRSTVDLGRRHRAVGSAILLDLVRAGRISIPAAADAKEARVHLVGSGPTGDAALDAALRKLSDEPKVGWAAENAGHEAWKPLLELLAADGAIRLGSSVCSVSSRSRPGRPPTPPASRRSVTPSRRPCVAASRTRRPLS
jgi:hypothetical protein